MHSRNPFFALLAAVILSGCAGSPTVATSGRVKPSTEAEVAQCAYLDNLVGASGWYGVFGSKGAENARRDLLNKAEAIGGTNVVWTDASEKYGGTSVQAKVYRCP